MSSWNESVLNKLWEFQERLERSALLGSEDYCMALAHRLDQELAFLDRLGREAEGAAGPDALTVQPSDSGFELGYD